MPCMYIFFPNRMSGCLAPCHRWEYELADGMDPPHSTPHKYDAVVGEGEQWMSFVVKIPNGRYLEYQQYFIYLFEDFVADIGGFLGLLLGHSLLSLYDSTAGWYRRKSNGGGGKMC